MLNPPLPCPFCGAALSPQNSPTGATVAWCHPYVQADDCLFNGAAIGAERVAGWNQRAIPLSLRDGFPVFGPGEKTIGLKELNGYMAYFDQRLSGMNQ